jgi:hypothetical protein
MIKPNEKFIVERNCCTSGNCIVCRRLAPLGTTVRVEHTRTVTEAEANRIAADFSIYKATVKPVA